MVNELARDKPGKGRLWAGRIVSAIPVFMLLMSCSMKLARKPEVIQGFVGHFGYPEGTLLPIGVTELLCTLLYALPWTRALGAVLLTGYLGGAIATHVRVGESFLPALGIGVVLWLGLYLRDPRLQAFLPFRPQPRL